jgi:predicted NodU family carbamoyl transferase
VVDGRLCAAINEERLIRKKNAWRFPPGDRRSAAPGRPDPREIDLVVFAGEITPLSPCAGSERHRNAKDFSGQFGMMFNLYTYYLGVGRKLGFPYRLDRWLSQRYLARQIRDLGFRCAVRMADHHGRTPTAPSLRPVRAGDGDHRRRDGRRGDRHGGVGRPDGRIERVFEQSG